MVMPINHLPGGKKLPVLSNPATAAQILAGYQAINGAGEVMVGSMGPGVKLVMGTFEGPRRFNTESINCGFKPQILWICSPGYYIYTDTIKNVTDFELGSSSLKDFFVLTESGFEFTSSNNLVVDRIFYYYALQL